MTAQNDRASESVLQRTKRAVDEAGCIDELAQVIGTRLRWRPHRDPDQQQRRWRLNVWQKLDGTGRWSWSLLDHLDARKLLGFDPTATVGVR